MTSTFSVIIFTFSSWSKDSCSTANHQFLTGQCPKSGKGQLLLCVHFLKEKKIFPQALQESLIVQHFIKCPSFRQALDGITVAGLNKHLSLLRPGGRPPHIKPQMGVLLPRKKWRNSCSEDTQRRPLPGRICNVFTTKYQDFWQSTEQLNTWRLSGLL